MTSQVTFRLFSTKLPGSKPLKDWPQAKDSFEDIAYDEDTNTASLKEGTRFDPNLKTIVTAHGNGGGIEIDLQFWKYYSEVAEKTEHFNIIGKYLQLLSELRSELLHLFLLQKF